MHPIACAAAADALSRARTWFAGKEVIFSRHRPGNHNVKKGPMTRPSVGPFELAVLEHVAVLGEMAFPAEIARHLSKKQDRQVSLAQVFIALERLEDKGYLSSRETEPERVRGGRRRRVFQLEASGINALSTITTASYRMSLSLQETPSYEEYANEIATA